MIPDPHSRAQPAEPVSTILVIDDDPNNLAIVADFLKSNDYAVLVAEDGESGVARARYARPDLILLDVMMPGMDGFATCRGLKALDSTRDIPVIFITALAETEHKLHGFEAGAVDYVTKPFQREELLARVGVHLRIRELTGQLRDANESLERRIEERTAELKESERRLRDILDFLPDPTFAVDLEKKIVLWNRTAEVFTGAKAEDMLGKSDHEYAIPFYGHRRPILIDLVFGESAETEKLYPVVRKEGCVISGEGYTRSVRGEEAYLLGTAAPLCDGNGNVIGAIESIHNITERKKAEESRERLLVELSRSNRELQQFAYVASHDLQEPLRGVARYVELLARRYKGRLDEQADKYIAFAVEGANRMHDLLNDLLDFSSVGMYGGSFQRVAMAAAVERALANLGSAIADVNPEIQVDPLPEVMGDHAQLVQVMQNLIGNALKYRKKETTLQIRISAERQEHEWLIGVHDNGMGIETEFIDRIFVIFQRLHTRTDYPGTGMGLAICRKIIELHGGRIWLESTPGQGASFYFTLPAAGPENKRGT